MPSDPDRDRRTTQLWSTCRPRSLWAVAAAVGLVLAAAGATLVPLGVTQLITAWVASSDEDADVDANEDANVATVVPAGTGAGDEAVLVIPATTTPTTTPPPPTTSAPAPVAPPTTAPAPATTEPAPPPPTIPPEEVSAPETAGAVVLATPSDMAVTALRLLNDRRIANGLAPLPMDNCIAGNVAQPWSNHMHATATLAHNMSVGEQVQGCTGRPGFGENVGRYRYTDLSLQSAIDGLDHEFWASPGHRSNVLGAWSAVGVAVTSGHNGVYITFAFAR